MRILAPAIALLLYIAARYIKNFLGHGTRDADVLSGANGGNASCPAFADARDADDAVRDLDGSLIGGRTVSVINGQPK